MERLPSLLSRPFDLAHAGEFLTFAAAGLLATLLALAPLLLLARFAMPGKTRWPALHLVFLASPTADALSRGGSHHGGAAWPWILLAVATGGAILYSRAARLQTTLRGLGRWSTRLSALVLVSGLVAALLPAKGRVRTFTTARAEQPNVLLISIDSLRRDHLHCYGYPRATSPNLDRLASQGMRFETVAAPTTWTLPSHLTLLTALPPERHGVVRDGLALAQGVRSLAQLFGEGGYATAGFVAGPYLDAGYGFARGFDLYDDYSVARATMREAHRVVTSPGSYRITSRWLDRWDREGRRRPFFVFLHLWDVHADYNPPEPYASMFRPDRAPASEGAPSAVSESVELGAMIARYDGEIAFTDYYLGRVFEQLRAMGEWDRTVVVVTADHGEEFREHGQLGHHKNLYDETLLVPLLIRYPPRVPAAAVHPSLVRLMDIAPTLLTLAGLARPPDFGLPEARDLSPYFDPKEQPRPRVAFADLDGELGAIRTDGEKLIACDGEGTSRECYDLSLDPGETRNLSGSDPVRSAALAESLDSWRRAMRGGADPGRVSPGIEQRELLRSLGYTRE
ncbi:MAG: sulfatase [Candidatus Eisenbacteria bacterium]